MFYSRSQSFKARYTARINRLFWQIAGRLEPLDILNLSRVAKSFRLTFASQRSRHIWIAVRRNIAPEMPECPHDLTEAQYASLMFENHCQVGAILQCDSDRISSVLIRNNNHKACGTSQGTKTDFSLRVRFCEPCLKAKWVFGMWVCSHPFVWISVERQNRTCFLEAVPWNFSRHFDTFA